MFSMRKVKDKLCPIAAIVLAANPSFWAFIFIDTSCSPTNWFYPTIKSLGWKN